MKKIMFALFVTVISINAISQNYFNNYYEATSVSFDFPGSIIYDNDRFIVLNTYDENGYGANIRLCIMNIENSGELESKRYFYCDTASYLQGRIAGSMKRFSSSSLFSVGIRSTFFPPVLTEEGHLFKYDNNLDTLWTRTFEDCLFKNFSIDKNQNLTVIGDYIDEMLLLNVDSTGNELWRKSFGTTLGAQGISVISIPYGGFALSYSFVVYPGFTNENYLIRTDSLGNELWRLNVGHNNDNGPLYLSWSEADSTIVGAYHTIDNNQLNRRNAISRLALVKIKSDTNLIVYEKKFMNENNPMQYSFHVNSININDDGEIVVAGAVTNDNQNHLEGFLFKFANIGDSLWYRQYYGSAPKEGNHYLTDVVSIPDGGFAASGYVVRGSQQDAWVIRVDSMGCISEGDCWTSKIEHLINLEKLALNIYPNPATTEITIVVPKENESEKHLLTIWDMYGRRAKEVEVPGGVTKTTLNLSGFSPGLYTAVSVHNGRVLFRGKFIKQ